MVACVPSTTCLDHGRKGFGLGYATAWVVIDGHKMCTTLHRKVHYEATGEWPEVVRHICDNARCIEPTHLRSGTQIDNVADMDERGRRTDQRNFGEDNGRAVLTDSECKYIRDHYIKGSRTNGTPALAAMFNTGTSQIWRIVNDKQRT